MKNEIKQAILEGLKSRTTARKCFGRSYVCLCKVDRSTLAAYVKAAKEIGLLYLPEAYGTGKRVIYIGYDNGAAVSAAQAEVVAENLKALGLPAYADTVED